jgi:hypothetical protein
MIGEKISKLKLHCPNCGRSLYGATREMIGDTGVCPKCKIEFVIYEKYFEESTEPKEHPNEDDQTEKAKCPVCGRNVALRAVDGSVSVRGSLFKTVILFKAAPVCICCNEVPCMVEDCGNRAAHIFQHDLLIKNVTKYNYPVPNDVWVCDSHCDIVSRYRRVNYIARILRYFALVITIIVLTVSVRSSKWARLLFAAPVVIIAFGAHSLAQNCAPQKKEQYSDEIHMGSDTDECPLGNGSINDSFNGPSVLSLLFGHEPTRTQGSVQATYGPGPGPGSLSVKVGEESIEATDKSHS